MKNPSRIPIPRIAVALCALACALLAGAGTAAAYVTPEQADAAAARGAAWFAHNQGADGSLAGDWALTALAAAGVHAADVRVSATAPSAQDHYASAWQAPGPGGVATDRAREILSGLAAGIEPQRVGIGRNLVAELVAEFDGTQIGSAQLLNDDIFGLLALDHAGAPEPLTRRIAAHIRAGQLPDGGWGWSASQTVSDTDMTGAAIAALCAAGAAQDDPAVRAALDLLHERQAPSGGFSAPPWIPVNTDSTAWVASGLLACGLDPQAAEWTTPAGNTPFDYLLAMQQPEGYFRWSADASGATAFATWNAVRPLGGAAFSAPVPPRADPSAPRWRPAPDAPEGAEAPIALLIDHGASAPPAARLRACSVRAEVGSDLGAFLASAREQGCVESFEVSPDGELVELNGLAATGEERWRVRTGDRPGPGAIALGDLVFVAYSGDERVDPPSSPSPPAGPGRPAKVRVGKRVRLSAGRIVVALRCPRGAAPSGCRGQLRVRAGGTRARRPFALRPRERSLVRVAAPKGLRRVVRARGRARARVVAATRSGDGRVAVTRARRTIRR